MTVVNVDVPEGGGGEGWGSEEWVPYRAQCSYAVKVRGFPLQMDVQGFNCFPSRIVGLHMLDCCCFPVHLVLFGPCVYCDAVLHIVSLHCSFVFTYPLLQCSSCFSDVDTLTFSAWYLVHDSFLLPLWLGVFCLHQCFPECSLRFEGCSDAEVPALPLYPFADTSHIR